MILVDIPVWIEYDRPLRLPKAIALLAGVALLSFGSASFALAHETHDDVPRTAVVSAFAPELSILKQELAEASTYSVNGVEFSARELCRASTSCCS